MAKGGSTWPCEKSWPCRVRSQKYKVVKDLQPTIHVHSHASRWRRAGLIERIWALGVQSRSVMESAMLILHCGRPYGTDSSRQRQDHARRPSCYTAIEGFDPRARQPLRS